MTTHQTRVPADDEAIDRLLDRAEDALDQGDPDAAVLLCGQVLEDHPDHAGALFVLADAHRDRGAVEDAEQAYWRVTLAVPDHAPGWSSLAAMLFEQLRFDEAHRACLRCLRIDPDNGEGNYVRALLRERRADYTGAERDYVRAARAEPDAFPRPVHLSDAMIEAVVEEASRALHPAIRSYLSQVPILVEEVPAEEVCRQYDPPAPPAEIVGIFHGASLTERSGDDPWSQLPATIVLYRRNLQRIAQDRDQLLSELQITVFHEIGHFLGLDEDDLQARGLD